MVELSIDKIKYGGLYHYFFWDKEFNPLATVDNCLANCTCYVIGDCGVTGTPRPVSRVVGAQDWDKYLTNDWTLLNFDRNKIKVGDIVQWVHGKHVARVFKIENGSIWVRASFYTGEHGTSMVNGEFDTRKAFNSLEEVNNFMIKNYPNRFYHEYPLEKEIAAVGSSPEHILSMPNTIKPVERDEYVNQIRTTDYTLRIRTSPSLSGSIVGHVDIGYYNVLAIEPASSEDKKWYKENKGENLDCWYEIAKDRWCGNVTTEYLPKKSDTDISKIFKEIEEIVRGYEERNKKLEEGMKEIADIANKLIN